MTEKQALHVSIDDQDLTRNLLLRPVVRELADQWRHVTVSTAFPQLWTDIRCRVRLGAPDGAVTLDGTIQNPPQWDRVLEGRITLQEAWRRWANDVGPVSEMMDVRIRIREEAWAPAGQAILQRLGAQDLKRYSVRIIPAHLKEQDNYIRPTEDTALLGLRFPTNPLDVVGTAWVLSRAHYCLAMDLDVLLPLAVGCPTTAWFGELPATQAVSTQWLTTLFQGAPVSIMEDDQESEAWAHRFAEALVAVGPPA